MSRKKSELLHLGGYFQFFLGMIYIKLLLFFSNQTSSRSQNTPFPSQAGYRSYRTPGGPVKSQEFTDTKACKSQGSSPAQTYTLPNSNSERFVYFFYLVWCLNKLITLYIILGVSKMLLFCDIEKIKHCPNQFFNSSFCSLLRINNVVHLIKYSIFYPKITKTVIQWIKMVTKGMIVISFCI